MSGYRLWTPSEVDRLRELRRAGLTRREIGGALGRTFKAIKWALYVGKGEEQ